MAPHDSESAMHDQLHSARLAAEWANVGLCGGMFRPVNGRSHGASEAPRRPPVVDAAPLNRNQRCCR